MEDKIFRLSIVVSILLHTIILTAPFFAKAQYEKKRTKMVELIYQPSIDRVKSQSSKKYFVEKIKKEVGELNPDVLSPKDKIYSPEINDLTKRPIKLEGDQKQPLKVSPFGGKRNVVIPIIESDKISSSKYINYHDRIRTKIKNRAYFYVDDPRFDVGEVYLTFVLSSDGSLKEIQIIDSKTQANDYLKTVGLRSIKESSPFPPFPDDLKYPELTFNVVISFEIGD